MDHIRELIAKGRLKGAIDVLAENLPRDNYYYQEVIGYQGSLRAITKEARELQKDMSDYRTPIARLKNSVMEVLTLLEEDDVELNIRGGKLKILFLGANPDATARIRIDREVSKIQQKLQASNERDNIDLEQRWAVTAGSLQDSLLQINPNIVHFSGHGEVDGIILESEDGSEKKMVDGDVLGDLFSLFEGSLECVFLNCCYSESQASAISRHIPYVIGMNAAVPDDAAIQFSEGFYRAKGGGRNYEDAFKFGIVAIKAAGVEGDDIPVLLKKGT